MLPLGIHEVYTLSHARLESSKKVLTTFFSITSVHRINNVCLYPLMFIMHDIAYFEMQIKLLWGRLREDLLGDQGVREVSF
jgi:hypothetical protein